MLLPLYSPAYQVRIVFEGLGSVSAMGGLDQEVMFIEEGLPVCIRVQGLQKSNICKYLQGPRSVGVEAHQISAICSQISVVCSYRRDHAVCRGDECNHMHPDTQNSLKGKLAPR